ncbi:MAG TPA: hypothetical protein VF148_18600 [Acidimicrobiia bacterium]
MPRYYVESPACTPDAARWLVDTGAKSIGFDRFPERAAKKQSYLPYEFVVHLSQATLRPSSCSR